MKYKIDQLSKTSQISKDYHVNPLLAKVIEEKGLSLEAYQQMINPRLIYLYLRKEKWP